MAVIITPAHMLPICPIAVKMAVRFAISKGLLILISDPVYFQTDLVGDSLPGTKDVYCATV
jgi:hypothetical protein